MRSLRELLDHLDEAAAKEGFAAGEANLFDAEIDKGADHAEVVVDAQLGEVGALVAGAAVDAAVVAAIGDGDAEVGDGAAELVAETAFRWRSRAASAPEEGGYGRANRDEG